MGKGGVWERRGGARGGGREGAGLWMGTGGRWGGKGKVVRERRNDDSSFSLLEMR